MTEHIRYVFTRDGSLAASVPGDIADEIRRAAAGVEEADHALDFAALVTLRLGLDGGTHLLRHWHAHDPSVLLGVDPALIEVLAQTPEIITGPLRTVTNLAGAMTDEDLIGSALFCDAPAGEFRATDWMFTTETIAGARTFVEGLDGPGEVWEHMGRYYPVRVASEEAAWLREAGASLIPPQDDALHHELDQILRPDRGDRSQ
jgi:hypothetical protein